MSNTTPISGVSQPGNELCFSVESLRSHLEQLNDPRKARGVGYRLVDGLTLLILAKLGGEDGLKGMAEWVRLREQRLLALLGIERKRLLHETTYERVLEKLDVAELEQMTGDFFAQKARGRQLTIVLDGKVLGGTIPEGAKHAVHLLAAYVPEQGVVLMQVEGEDQGNELTATPRLLEALDLRGWVVTGDALFTQREVCEQIVQAGGDYVFPVKDNQAGLRHSIAELFMPAPLSPGHSPVRLPESYAQTCDCRHGRIEYRYLTASSQLNHYLDWPHLGQVFRLQRVVQRQKTGRLTYQLVFGVTSLNLDECSPQRLLHLIRQHWHIENRLHYVRDVSFAEDACPIRHTRRQCVLACLNNLVIGLLRQTRFDYLPEARPFFALHFDQTLNLLL